MGAAREAKPKDEGMSTKGERRREEILAVARSVLIEDGYDAFVLRGIADRIGIKLGNLQYYFPTREDLVESIARAENQKAIDLLESVTNSRESTPGRIEELVQGILGQWQAEGGKIFAVVTLLAVHKQRFRTVYADYYSLFYDAIGDVLTTLEPDTPRATIQRKARLATALLDGALLQVPLARGRGSRKENLEFVAEITTAMQRMLGYEF